jgi:hypothetical protein
MSPSLGETTSELPLVHQSRIGHQRKKLQNFYQKTEPGSRTWCFLIVFLFLIFIFIIPVLLTSPSLFFYPCSYPLLFPSFSWATIHCSISQLLFLPLHIYSVPNLHLSFLSSPNLSPHYPSLLHTHHPMTNLLYQLYTTRAPAIPDTSTLHYNNRNIPKHTQGPQNPAASIPLTSPTHPFPHLPLLYHSYQFPKIYN